MDYIIRQAHLYIDFGTYMARKNKVKYVKLTVLFYKKKDVLVQTTFRTKETKKIIDKWVNGVYVSNHKYSLIDEIKMIYDEKIFI